MHLIYNMLRKSSQTPEQHKSQHILILDKVIHDEIT